MIKQQEPHLYWKTCRKCQGQGLKKQKTTAGGVIYAHCKYCKGAGIMPNNTITQVSKAYPHIAIIGAGIGGMALAVACQQRGIGFTLYEKDADFYARAQGYGLTLQQASKAIKGFGITTLKQGINSTKHVVHNTKGDVLGQWGMRKWLPKKQQQKKQQKSNIHIARQALRLALYEQLPDKKSLKWGHQFISCKTRAKDQKIILDFMANGKKTQQKADIVVGADGIFSTVRTQFLQHKKTPLRYLNCMVILGICALEKLKDLQDPLLDGATVFQSANGKDRIYIMPFDKNTVMWQLSFVITEQQAKALRQQGSKALQQKAIEKTNWHTPIPEIVTNTDLKYISGYPVYDRALLDIDFFKQLPNHVLIGDAAHPMSPFKGQGANQALLDALSLAKHITKKCDANQLWDTSKAKNDVLEDFIQEMLERSAKKVTQSAAAADFLHSNSVLDKKDQPRRE